MKPKLQPLSDQIVVLTGASSGIGLATARMAAERGAHVVLVSRDDEDLARASRDIEDRGGRAFAASEKYAPRIFDLMKEATAFEGQQSGLPTRDDDTLHRPRPGDGRVYGNYPGRVLQSSAYTTARLHRGRTLLGLAVIGAGLLMANRSRN